MSNDSLNAITEENLVEDIAADICDTVSRLNGIAYTPKQWMGTARNALAHFKYHSGKTSEIRLDFEDVKKAATAIHAASQKLHGCSILNSTCLIYAEAALMATHKPVSGGDTDIQDKKYPASGARMPNIKTDEKLLNDLKSVTQQPVDCRKAFKAWYESPIRPFDERDCSPYTAAYAAWQAAWKPERESVEDKQLIDSAEETLRFLGSRHSDTDFDMDNELATIHAALFCAIHNYNTKNNRIEGGKP